MKELSWIVQSSWWLIVAEARAAKGGGGGVDGVQKTRTPHSDVGDNNKHELT